MAKSSNSFTVKLHVSIFREKSSNINQKCQQFRRKRRIARSGVFLLYFFILTHCVRGASRHTTLSNRRKVMRGRLPDSLYIQAEVLYTFSTIEYIKKWPKLALLALHILW
jgi:hypothetical protein